MILDELKKQTLQNLLTYKDCLESLSLLYEQRLLPYYGMATEFDKRTQLQMDANARLGEIKSRLSEVYKAIEYVVFKEMDSLKDISADAKTVKKTRKYVKRATKKD